MGRSDFRSGLRPPRALGACARVRAFRPSDAVVFTVTPAARLHGVFHYRGSLDGLHFHCGLSVLLSGCSPPVLADTRLPAHFSLKSDVTQHAEPDPASRRDWHASGRRDARVPGVVRASRPRQRRHEGDASRRPRARCPCYARRGLAACATCAPRNIS
jgi:hypothetical protein